MSDYVKDAAAINDMVAAIKKRAREFCKYPVVLDVVSLDETKYPNLVLYEHMTTSFLRFIIHRHNREIMSLSTELEDDRRLRAEIRDERILSVFQVEAVKLLQERDIEIDWKIVLDES